MKTVDEMADELCRVMHGATAPAYRAKYQRIAKHVLDLIAQAKPAPSPGDSMTDEEVAKVLRTLREHGAAWTDIAVRARELFRPGSKAPEGEAAGATPMVKVETAKCRLLERRLRVVQDAACKLARHARDLMAAARVQENIDEIGELIDEWADDDLDDDDLDDPDDDQR